MTTQNQNLTHILDRMYNMRSEIRSVYLNSSAGTIYSLETSIRDSVSSLFKNKGSIDINVKEFTINISLIENHGLSNRTIQNIYFRIDSMLREFIKSNATNSQLVDYVSETINSILDYYVVGDSIKFLL